jgi:tetratricopeptide (TPR) repeat protein
MNRKERRAAEKLQRPPLRGIASAAQPVFADALRRHQAGSLKEAEQLYRRVLAFNPRHADSLQLLGVLAHQTGRHDLGVELIRQAIAINPLAPSCHANLGNVLREQQRWDEAIASYRKALELKPDDVDTHINLGVVLQEQGRLEEAIATYRRAIEQEPGDPGIRNNLAAALHALGRGDEAIACYRQARALQPNRPETHANLGDALRVQGQLDEAIASCRKALELKPDYPDAHNNLGLAFAGQRRWQEAEAAFRQAIAHRPDFALAHNNLASTLVAQGHPEEAVPPYRRAIELNPAYPDAYSGMGNALRRLGQVDDAIAACRKALELSPDMARAHDNLAVALLLAGDMAAGWPELEWRWKVPGLLKPHRFMSQRQGLQPQGSQPQWSQPQGLPPQWHGEAAEGRTLLIHAEQGLGDSIQFCRYAPLAAERGLRVTMEVPRPLVRLLRFLPGVDVKAAGDVGAAFDLHCPMLSLPLAFDTRLTSVPAAVPYLSAEQERVAAWRDRLPAGRIRIGIAWQGNPTFAEDRIRSAPLRCFEPLARLPGVRLVSLQKQHGLEQLADLPEGMTVATLGDDFDAGPDAFIDTAAVMANLDLVISTDTSIVHLAGALGRPVWVALSAVPEWYWMLDRTDSPWYPTMRLFRQRERGDWPSVFAAIAAQVAESWGG